MATYRIGIGSFNLKDGAVGIGTESSGLGNLKVEGTVKTTDLDVTGVSTFTRYAGFAADDININRDTSFTGEVLTTGDIVVGVNSTFTVSVGATVDVGTVPSVSIGTHFSPPKGDINDGPEVPVEGTVRYNRDLNTLEFYNGVDWRQFTVSGQRGRGIVMGGYNATSFIQYFDIVSKGNAENFGALHQAVNQNSSHGNSIRSLSSGATATGADVFDYIQYVTIASQGDSIDFGNLTSARRMSGSGGSSTRGLTAGGVSPSSSPHAALNVIDYVEIMTTGNSTDFGDLSVARRISEAVCSSPTRTVFHGGNYPGTPAVNVIDYVTTASKGNATDFGAAIFSGNYACGCSNSVRGLFGGGNSPISGGDQKRIGVITIASTGNSTDFGALTVARHHAQASSNSTRACWAGGGSPEKNIIDYVTIQTGGEAEDFGDLIKAVYYGGGTSDSHGGLGGY